jgi:hypothetical protein
MAKAVAQHIDEAEAIPPPVKQTRPGARTRPRPEAPTQSTAEYLAELDADVDTPFFDWLKRYPEKHWGEQLTAYLFRTAPVIDRGRTGNYHYVEKFTRPFDEEEIKKAKNGGSGGYKVTLTRWNPNQARRTDRIRDYYFTILDQEYPPCIPLGEWIDSDKNKEWLWAKPKLKELQERDEAAARLLSNGTPLTSATPFGQGMGELNAFTAVMGVVERFLPKSDPQEVTKLASSVVETLKTMNAQNQSKGDSVLGDLVLALVNKKEDSGMSAVLTAIQGELAEERKRNHELMMKMMDGGKAASLADQLDSLVKLKEVATSVFGRGAKAPEPTGWAEIAAHSVEKLVDNIPVLTAAFRNRPDPAPANGTGRRSTVTVEREGAAPLPASEQPQRTAPPTAEEKSQMIRNLATQFGPMFDDATPFLVNIFQTDGGTGMHFRNWFKGEYGNQAYEIIRKMAPETLEGIINLRRVEAPEHIKLKLAMLEPGDKVRKFILEFFSDTPTPEDEEASDEPPSTTEAYTPKEF